MLNKLTKNWRENYFKFEENYFKNIGKVFQKKFGKNIHKKRLEKIVQQSEN